MAALCALVVPVVLAQPPEGVDHWIVARRGPTGGYGIVATPDNIVTALKGQAAADGLLQLGDVVVECDGELLAEPLSALVKRSGRSEHTLGVRRYVLEEPRPPGLFHAFARRAAEAAEPPPPPRRSGKRKAEEPPPPPPPAGGPLSKYLE